MAQLTESELLSPYYIESCLRHSYADVFHDFLKNNSPKFENFRSTRNKILVSGKGYDLSIFTCHVEYIRLLEQTVKNLLLKISLPQERFVIAALHHTDSNDVAIKSLMWTLTRYQDFDSFAEMMEDDFNEQYLYPQQKLSATIIPDSVSASSAAHKKSVRVLWDIENISVSKKVGGMRTVTAINNFLKSQNLRGPGIETRITAFFGIGKINKPVITELDKAAVELVWVSLKREDADRKLGTRIMQEMAVLSPHTTTIVIISSDTDFRSHVQHLTNNGYTAIVIHDAPDDNTTWKHALEMHASQSFKWSSVMQEHGGISGVQTVLARSQDADDDFLIRNTTSRSPSLASLDDNADGEWVPPTSALQYDDLSQLSNLAVRESLVKAQRYTVRDSPSLISMLNNRFDHEVKDRDAATVTHCSNGSASGAMSVAATDDVKAHVLGLTGKWKTMNLPRSLVVGEKSGWIQSWRGPFGFACRPVKLDLGGTDTEPNQITVRIYCHHTVIRAGTDGQSRLFLEKGQKVMMHVDSEDRGLFATSVNIV